MLYRAPLFIDCVLSVPREIDDEAASLITDAQWRWFATQSIRLNRSVLSLLQEMRPCLEQVNSEAHEVFLLGCLPNCGLYGCIAPDGSAHT